MKKDFIISLIFGLIGLLAGLFVVPYQLENLKLYLPAEDYHQMINELTIPYAVLISIAAIQLGVITIILSFIGIKLARNLNLKLPILDALLDSERKVSISKKWFTSSLLLGMLGGFIIIASDKYIFRYYISLLADHPPSFSIHGLLAGIFYGGIIEEIFMRLFLMSLMIWLIRIIWFRGRNEIPIPIYWVSIVLVAVAFAVGHFPATIAFFGELTPVLIIRGLLLNGLFGIVFGYLYWREGIEYAMLSHITSHISMQLLFIPILY